jgi:thymidylate synthase ThyX
MSYDVQIIADSVGPNGARITTFSLKYPRMVHAELMTHRMFSRNASSTRAIPTARMMEWVRQDPAMPVYWGKNQRGMQATAELTESEQKRAARVWRAARDEALDRAQQLLDFGVHKQIASRILEPWAHINVVVTATSFDNFFALRCHPTAMPEIQVLAVRMARAYLDNRPAPLEAGEWHLPYVTPEDWPRSIADQIKISVARCARVSYRTFDGKAPDPEEDIALHDRLRDNGHWSPFEHQAKAMNAGDGDSFRSGNFRGWVQYRQMLPKSVHDSFDFSRLDEFGDREFMT